MSDWIDALTPGDLESSRRRAARLAEVEGHSDAGILARESVPALLAEVDRLTRERDQARAEVADAYQQIESLPLDGGQGYSGTGDMT